MNTNEVMSTNSGRQLVAPKDQPLNFRTIINSNEDILDNRIEDIELNEEDPEENLIDSFFAQSRIVERVNDFIIERANESPGCVERFVCETYRTGETLEGIPYLAMQLTNAAVSFMVADMFEDSKIDIQQLTRAARYGRTKGTCHTMTCDFLDNQLRTVGDYLGTFEEFLTQIFNSISESLNFGREKLGRTSSKLCCMQKNVSISEEDEKEMKNPQPTNFFSISSKKMITASSLYQIENGHK